MIGSNYHFSLVILMVLLGASLFVPSNSRAAGIAAVSPIVVNTALSFAEDGVRPAHAPQTVEPVASLPLGAVDAFCQDPASAGTTPLAPIGWFLGALAFIFGCAWSFDQRERGGQPCRTEVLRQ